MNSDPRDLAGRRWAPPAWALWRLRPRAVAYVLAVDVVAVAVVLARSGVPTHVRDWVAAAILVASAVGHLHLSHATERIRRDHSHTPHVDLCSIWIFAGALVLPPLPETALVVLIYAHRWALVGRWDASRPPHRTIFTTAMMLLAALAVGIAVPRSALDAHPAGWLLPVTLLAAIVVQWTVNTGLLATVIALTVRVRRPQDVLGSGADNLLEAAQLALGGFVAVGMGVWPGLAVLMVVPAVALHRTVLLHQLQLAARTDDKTGLLNATAWHQQASAELARISGEHAGGLGLLMIDLDRFKEVNDRWGHLVGDAVLRQVARVVARSVRRGDSVGRFGGEEFAVLLPGAGSAEAVAVAERIRSGVHALRPEPPDPDSGTPHALTVSVGVAVYPEVREGTLDGLIAAADSALYAAKDAGRDQVRLAGRQRRRPWSPTVRDSA